MSGTRASAKGAGLAAVVSLALWAGCSEHQKMTGPECVNATEVVLSNYAFSPACVTISVGTTVTWRNGTSNYHTVTPDGHTEWTEWQTNTVDETFQVTFDTPGTYDYYCAPHVSLGMEGTVVVE